MTCPVCQQYMVVNGAFWQCPAGHLVPYEPGKPNGVVPVGTARLPLTAQ